MNDPLAETLDEAALEMAKRALAIIRDETSDAALLREARIFLKEARQRRPQSPESPIVQLLRNQGAPASSAPLPTDEDAFPPYEDFGT